MVSALSKTLSAMSVLLMLVPSSSCTDSESSVRPSWDSFDVRIVADRIKGIVSEENPAHPDEAVTFQVGSFGGQVLHIPDVRFPDSSSCLTCSHQKSPSNLNSEPYWTPDGRHIVFRSTRDLPKGSNPISGSEIYIMNSDGSQPQRLTFFNGLARVPRVSIDGKRLFWSQVTSDNRMHLVFADLVEQDGRFSLGPVREVRILGREGDDWTSLSNRLSLVEWKYPSPIGDWWSIFATFGSTLNTDAYALSLEAGEVRRLTSHPENNETAAWDPSGLGIAIQSGQNYDQARQLFPLPVPTFMDYIFVFLSLVVAQIGGAVPWVYDLYYMDDLGESGMIKLVDSSREGLFTFPGRWIDHATLPFNQGRYGRLASPNPSEATRRYGYVEFQGRSPTAHAVDGKPAFLDGATLETYPLEVVPFDVNEVYPTIEEAIPGTKSGVVRLSIRDTQFDYEKVKGRVSVQFENFSNTPLVGGEYALTGRLEGEYDLGFDLTQLKFDFRGELEFTDTEGLALKLSHDWRMNGLTLEADIVYVWPANTERREIRFPLSVFFAGQ